MNAPFWFSNLLFWSAQVALIVLAAWLLVRLLRIRQPRTLLFQWRTLLIFSCLLPLLQPWRPLPQFAANATAPGVPMFQPAPALTVAASRWHFPAYSLIAQILAALIFLGILVRFAIFLLGLLKLRHLLRTSSPIVGHAEPASILERAQSLIGARAGFRLSAQIASPVTFGFRAPVILVPERFLWLNPQSQFAIVCHELLHVRRHDWLHHLAEEILRIIFWFHPPVLWLVARIRLVREQFVDLEIVRLTQARKPYLDALLEFTSSPRRISAAPAPPFLVERQLVERVSLMLKEVRMSRTRMIASLSAIACSLVLCAIFAVSVFPLKAAPRIVAAAQSSVPATRPVVEANSIWIAKVNRGDMPIQVRGLAKLGPSGNAENPIVRVSLSESMMADVHVGQSALVNTHKAVVKGNVSSVSPTVIEGVRTADITLDSPLPTGTDSSAAFDATIEVGKLENVVYVGRPALFSANSQGPVLAQIFKVVENGNAAQRLTVQFGRASATTIQVLSGLKFGDSVILSDMSPYDKFTRIQIKR